MCALTCAGYAQDAQAWLGTMLQHENEATARRGRYMYLNEERSERTGGHQWLERVVETDWGKVRFLIAEDGQPLSSDRQAAQQARLADEAAHPEVFKKQESARVDSEQHARDMLTLLPKAFLLEEPRLEGDAVRIAYHPNPAYSPTTMEEKVLHAMSGSVLIDRKQVRMREVDGHTSQDVSVGFGFASVKAGSNFTSVRMPADGADYKLQSLHADIRGKALFLKIARAQEVKHSEFHRVPEGLTVAAAVAMAHSQVSVQSSSGIPAQPLGPRT